MRYAVAVWNYQEPEKPLAKLAAELADFGFDALSLSLHTLHAPDEAARRDLAAVVRDRDLAVTLHTNFDLFTEQNLTLAVELFAARLYSVTFDAAMESTSCGRFYAAARMARVLQCVAKNAPEVRFAVEDFPLDAAASAHYRDDLASLAGCPEYGILLDLGHMHLRQGNEPYFREKSLSEHLRDVPLPVIEVHVHDNDGKSDLHQHPGTGNADLAAMAEGLKAVGFTGVSTIEVAPTHHGSTPAHSRQMLGESLKHWRRLLEG